MQALKAVSPGDRESQRQPYYRRTYVSVRHKNAVHLGGTVKTRKKYMACVVAELLEALNARASKYVQTNKILPKQEIPRRALSTESTARLYRNKTSRIQSP